MKAWLNTTLGEFVALQRGHDLTEPQRRVGKVPVMGSAGQNGFHDTALANGPGIVIGRSGASFGQVHFSKEDFWPHNPGLYVTDFKGNDPLFAFYFLKALDFDRFNSGSAQPSANRNFIYPIPIRVPKPAEQKAIAAVLGALDEKIELNRRMNATLEAMARALFQSWFVDFDPVRAKLSGQGFKSPRREKAAKGFESPYLHLYTGSFQDSPLGQIPKGWEVVKLGDLCSKITDGAHQSPKSVERGRPMASVKDMTNWGITIEGCRHISEADFVSLVANGCQPQEGDVLLAKDGATCLDTACEYRQSDEIVLLSSVAILRPRFAHVSSYIHIWLSLDATKFYLKESFVSGSAIPRVVLRDLKQARIVQPPPAVSKAFDEAVAPLRNNIRQNDHQSRTLATLRDTLLPKLLCGELSVAGTQPTGVAG